MKTHSFVVNANGRSDVCSLLMHFCRHMGLLDGSVFVRAAMQHVFATEDGEEEEEEESEGLSK